MEDQELVLALASFLYEKKAQDIIACAYLSLALILKTPIRYPMGISISETSKNSITKSRASTIRIMTSILCCP